MPGNHQEEAINWLLKAAANEHISAAFDLGMIYLQKDQMEAAIKWFKRAAIKAMRMQRIN